MDTNLGVISITEKQVSRLSDLKTDVINGFSYWASDGHIVVVSERELTTQEISDLKSVIASLPDEYSQDHYRQAFDLVLFQTDLADLLPALSNPILRWEFAAMNTYATNKDFEGLVGYIDMLVSAGAATADDKTAVVGLLTKQGIEV